MELDLTELGLLMELCNWLAKPIPKNDQFVYLTQDSTASDDSSRSDTSAGNAAHIRPYPAGRH